MGIFLLQMPQTSENERSWSPISWLKSQVFGEFLSFFQKRWPKDLEKSQIWNHKSDLEAQKARKSDKKNLTKRPSEADSKADRELEKMDVETHFSPPWVGLSKESSKKTRAHQVIRAPRAHLERSLTTKKNTKEIPHTKACAPSLAEPDQAKKGAQKMLEKKGVQEPPGYPRWAKSPDSPPIVRGWLKFGRRPTVCRDSRSMERTSKREQKSYGYPDWGRASPSY